MSVASLNVDLRDAREEDFPCIVELNAAEVQHTSAMDMERLRVLHALAGYHRVATLKDKPIAFLLAMPDGVAYVNDNYRWFATRLSHFFYVDRIVISAEMAGQGIGRRLYQDLFVHVKARGIGTVACEYNIEPLNGASRAFHERFGFRELGAQWVAKGSKKVSMQVMAL